MKYPKYVKLKTIALRYRKDYNDYYCDNGEWGVRFFEKVLYSPHTFENSTELTSRSPVDSVNGVRLIRCTEAEWVESVGPYIPRGYKLKESYNDKCVEPIDDCSADTSKGSIKNNNKYLLIRR